MSTKPGQLHRLMREPEANSYDEEPQRKVDAQLLRDRSRASGFDLLKLLISLSTGGVATYFIALTGETRPQLNEAERWVVWISLSLMVSAVLVGLLGWTLDAAFFRYWAKSIENGENGSGIYWEKRQKFNRRRLFAIRLLPVLFLLGVIGSGVYVALRSD